MTSSTIPLRPLPQVGRATNRTVIWSFENSPSRIIKNAVFRCLLNELIYVSFLSVAVCLQNGHPGRRVVGAASLHSTGIEQSLRKKSRSRF